VQAKRDTESSIFNSFWIPAFAGMTSLKVFSTIMTQSLDPESMVRQAHHDGIFCHPQLVEGSQG